MLEPTFPMFTCVLVALLQFQLSCINKYGVKHEPCSYETFYTIQRILANKTPGICLVKEKKTPERPQDTTYP